MDWRKLAFDWNRARAFLVTAEEGSFSAAARATSQSQPTLGRQVTALEDELGVALFERVGHRLVLTATGLELLEQVRAMHQAAARMSLIAAGQSQTIDGLVRIGASQAVSTHLLPPVVAALRRDHPGIEIELVASDAASDLRLREADIAVRHFRPAGDDLVATLVKPESHAHLYGSPAYLRRIGRPKTPAGLAKKAQVLGFDDDPLMKNILHDVGYPFPDHAFLVRSKDHLVQWALAKQGVGLCVMMEEVGDPEPLVQRALPAGPPVVTLPIWLVSHRELRTSRRIRVVFDALAAHFAPPG